MTNTQGHIGTEVALKTNSIYQTALGTDQSEFSPLLSLSPLEQSDPPYLAISDTYMEFVRSGLITPIRGKMGRLDKHTATIIPSNEHIDDVAAVVHATGFEAASSLSFLPESLLQTLSCTPGDLNNTIALAFHGTHHPSIPHLGFVGFYRAPYWGVIEMQSRFLAALWSAGGPSSPSLPAPIQTALRNDISIQRTLSLRHDPRSSQFPMGDYPFMMQDFAAALGLRRSKPDPSMVDHPMDILTPARYPAPSLTDGQAAEVNESLRQTRETAVAGLTGGRFVAPAVFRSLLGEWRLERSLVSRLPGHPTGHFSGTAKFLLRSGTADGRGKLGENAPGADGDDGDMGLEYLYVEDGDFRAENGMQFRATRRYVWRYDEARDKLSVWFVKTDDQKRADYLFHEIDFIVPDAAQDGSDKGWEAKAGHLCVEDFYDVNYEFCFKAVNLREWRIRYTVKGPKKDYTIDGVYQR